MPKIPISPIIPIIPIIPITPAISISRNVADLLSIGVIKRSSFPNYQLSHLSRRNIFNNLGKSIFRVDVITIDKSRCLRSQDDRCCSLVQRYETNVRYRIESLSATDCWRDCLTTNRHKFKLQRGATLGNTPRVAYQQLHLFPSFRYRRFPHLRQLAVLRIVVDSDAARSVPNYMVEPQPYTVPSFPRYEANAKTDSDSRSDVACVRLSRFKLVSQAFPIRRLQAHGMTI